MNLSKRSLPLLLLALSLLLFQGYDFWEGTQKYQNAAQEEREIRNAALSKQILDSSARIDHTMDEIVRAGQMLQRHIEERAYDETHVVETLKKAFQVSPRLDSIGVAFAKNAHPSGSERQFLYLERARAEIVQKKLSHDYLAPENTWYHDPIFEGPKWVQPIISGSDHHFQAAFAIPFRLKGVAEQEAPSGVIFTGLEMGDLRNQVAALGARSYGYAMMFTPKGFFVVHPRSDWVGTQGKTLFERVISRGKAAQILNTTAIEAIYGVELTDRVRFKDYIDDLTGQEARIFYRRLNVSNWVLAVVSYKDKIQFNDMKHKRAVTAILAGLLFFVILGFVVVLCFPSLRAVELMSTYLSILLCLALSFLWTTADLFPKLNASWTRSQENRLLDEYALAKQLRTFEKRHGPTIQVPTGIYIQNVDLASETKAIVSGIIWQKYDTKVHQGLERGIIFPDSHSQPDLKVYREQKGNQELIRWYFTTTINIASRHEEYPFDEPTISLRLWHQNFDENVVLVPDFDSYKIIKPDTLPGISNSLAISGWQNIESYFNYGLSTYNTDFGATNYNALEEFPELYFNLTIKREFISPFVSKVIPVLVMAILLFCILLTITKIRTEAAGFSGTNVILGCAALFFVVIFEHISLRSALESSQIIYFEYFYFTLYIAMTLVMVNAIFFTSAINIKWLEYRDNIIPKILFWPVLLGFLFLMTLNIL